MNKKAVLNMKGKMATGVATPYEIKQALLSAIRLLQQADNRITVLETFVDSVEEGDRLYQIQYGVWKQKVQIADALEWVRANPPDTFSGSES